MGAELAHVFDVFNVLNSLSHSLNGASLQHAGSAQRKLGLQQVHGQWVR